MRTFQQFLEDKAPIVFTAFYGDGRVVVYIRGKKYVYATDAILTCADTMEGRKFRVFAKKAPGKAFRFQA